MQIETKRLQTLQSQATALRRTIIEMVCNAQSGHVGGSLSATELMVTLYHELMNHRPDQPNWNERDRFVLSKGHCTPVYYATLASCGYFPAEDLKTFRKPGSHLQGHPHSLKTPGVDASTGTLGIGLSTACGLALAGKIRKQSHRVFAIVGDGESQEGQIWEAAMFAHKYKLGNLIAFTDRNRLQTDGNTENIMPLDPLPEKWKAFGWDSWEIDGHDIPAIIDAVSKAEANPDRPTMIVANTIKGRGVSFMENEVRWHGTPPNAKECELALSELS